VGQPFRHLSQEKCKLRELYRENWIEWTERGKARRIEAFRFLESELRNATLAVAAPGGLDWWQDDVKPLEQAPTLLQKKVPSEMEPLTAPPQSATREGLATLGTPEYAARPTWLAAVPQPSGSTGGGGGSGGGAGGTPPAPNSVPALAKNAAAGGSTPVSLPLWMESAMKLGTRFLRIAAAGVPQAALGFEPHEGEPRAACCRECGCDHPVLIDEYYFWLVDTQYYTYTDQTDTQSNPDSSFAGSSVSRIPTTIRSSNGRRNGTTRIRCDGGVRRRARHDPGAREGGPRGASEKAAAEGVWAAMPDYSFMAAFSKSCEGLPGRAASMRRILRLNRVDFQIVRQAHLDGLKSNKTLLASAA
jgi:hypothetical protein